MKIDYTIYTDEDNSDLRTKKSMLKSLWERRIMKRDIREKNYISGETATGITVETTQYFATREEMHQAAREAMKNGTEYPEIILDTWDCVKIDFSGFDDMAKTEIKNFIWIPVF